MDANHVRAVRDADSHRGCRACLSLVRGNIRRATDKTFARGTDENRQAQDLQFAQAVATVRSALRSSGAGQTSIAIGPGVSALAGSAVPSPPTPK